MRGRAVEICPLPLYCLYNSLSAVMMCWVALLVVQWSGAVSESVDIGCLNGRRDGRSTISSNDWWCVVVLYVRNENKNHEPHSRFTRLWLAWSHGGGITGTCRRPVSLPADRRVQWAPTVAAACLARSQHWSCRPSSAHCTRAVHRLSAK